MVAPISTYGAYGDFILETPFFSSASENGTIIPCCLDSEGIINLGNIYQEELTEILNKQIVKEMIEGFRKGYKCQELCKHCSFLETQKK